MFNPSEQQLAVRDFILNQTGNLMVKASAGSGKTSTLAWVAEQTPKNLSSLAIAFAKVNAEDFKKKFPATYTIGTCHSICNRALQRHLPRRPVVDKYRTKVPDIVKNMMQWSDFELYGKFVIQLVGYGKNAGLGTHLAPNSPEEWYQLIDHYSLFLASNEASEEVAVHYAQQALEISSANVGLIDFDDMLYLALRRKVSFDKWNLLMLDEAQDTNDVQIELIKQMVAPNGLGRIILVGDDNQSMYGFRGAQANAMQIMADHFQCTILPLSVSFRCSQSVVREARKILT